MHRTAGVANVVTGDGAINAMGIVIPFPARPRPDIELKLRLWELVLAGARDGDDYRRLGVALCQRRPDDPYPTPSPRRHAAPMHRGAPDDDTATGPAWK